MSPEFAKLAIAMIQRTDIKGGDALACAATLLQLNRLAGLPEIPGFEGLFVDNPPSPPAAPPLPAAPPNGTE